MDRFDALAPGVQPCHGWGLVFGTADVDVSAGSLTMTARTTPGSFGGCASDPDHPVPFGDGGLFVEGRQLIATGHYRAGLAVFGTASTQVFLSVFEGKLRLQLHAQSDEIAAVPYDPVAMRWWRVRPDRMADTTVVEYAADGYHWTRFDEVDGRPETVAIELGAGVEPGAVVDSNPATAQFANLDVCPPR